MNDRSDKPASQIQVVATSTTLAPPDYHDPVIEVYKKDVDRTLLRENLKLSVEERLRKAEMLHASVADLAGSGPTPGRDRHKGQFMIASLEQVARLFKSQVIEEKPWKP